MGLLDCVFDASVVVDGVVGPSLLWIYAARGSATTVLRQEQKASTARNLACVVNILEVVNQLVKQRASEGVLSESK